MGACVEEWKNDKHDAGSPEDQERRKMTLDEAREHVMSERTESRCAYWEPTSEFTAFYCRLASGHVDDHYDSTLDSWRPNIKC